MIRGKLDWYVTKPKHNQAWSFAYISRVDALYMNLTLELPFLIPTAHYSFTVNIGLKFLGGMQRVIPTPGGHDYLIVMSPEYSTIYTWGMKCPYTNTFQLKWHKVKLYTIFWQCIVDSRIHWQIQQCSGMTIKPCYLSINLNQEHFMNMMHTKKAFWSICWKEANTKHYWSLWFWVLQSIKCRYHLNIESELSYYSI